MIVIDRKKVPSGLRVFRRDERSVSSTLTREHSCASLMSRGECEGLGERVGMG